MGADFSAREEPRYVRQSVDVLVTDNLPTALEQVPFLIVWAANAWRLSDALFFPFLAALGTAFGFIVYAWLEWVFPGDRTARRTRRKS